MTKTNDRFMAAVAVAAATVLTAVLVIPAFFSAAGATEGCGEYSYGFPGTRLLNDGISNVSGPYDIELPAGTYTVTLVAHDHHDTQVDVGTQPGEQYVVELNSGYVSGPSTDIPDDEILTTTVYPNQTIDASSSITVRHYGVPGINSVDVVCVGFTPEATAPPTAPAEPPVVVNPPVQDIGDPLTIVREPVPATTETPSTTPPAVVTPDAVVTPEVEGVVESPAAAPQLAITGPTEHGQTLAMIGLMMLAVGGLLVRRERHLAETGR